jgi:hypothetical protein
VWVAWSPVRRALRSLPARPKPACIHGRLPTLPERRARADPDRDLDRDLDRGPSGAALALGVLALAVAVAVEAVLVGPGNVHGPALLAGVVVAAVWDALAVRDRGGARTAPVPPRG